MDRYPIILWIGAAVLGKVGGEMMITDPWVHGLLNPPKWADYAAMAFFVVFVCALSKWLISRRKDRAGLEPTTIEAAVTPSHPEGLIGQAVLQPVTVQGAVTPSHPEGK